MKVKMIISTEILKFANEQQEFSRKGLLERFAGLPGNSVLKPLYRLLNNKRLERVKQGIYRLPLSLFTPTEEIKQLNDLLKNQFAYANFCFWSSDVLMPFMHHIPNMNFTYIDVENDVAASVFNYLKSQITETIYFRPRKEDFERYLTGTKAIIIRNLISESPLQMFGHVQTPTFEKMLVDVAGDVEFDFMQGAEISFFYKNVLDRNNINKSKLVRYASRRGRREEVEQLYKENL